MLIMDEQNRSRPVCRVAASSNKGVKGIGSPIGHMFLATSLILLKLYMKYAIYECREVVLLVWVRLAITVTEKG